jgi:hypothetical protein
MKKKPWVEDKPKSSGYVSSTYLIELIVDVTGYATVTFHRIHLDRMTKTTHAGVTPASLNRVLRVIPMLYAERE